MSNTNQEAPAFAVVEVRRVRAASAGEAVDVAEADLHTALSVDTGEAGHVAGGRVFGVVGVENSEGWDGLTTNQALLEAAMLLIEAATLEGDDGSGGYFTIRDLEVVVDQVTDTIATLKAARS